MNPNESRQTRNSAEKFLGNYRGIVIDNNDPMFNGRCKIRIFGVYDELLDDDLPWATFCDPFMGGLQGIGSSFIPNIETHVWCFFEGGDHRLPAYFAGAPAMNGEGSPDVPEESQENYPNNRVIKTKGGIIIEFDDTEDNVRIKTSHPSGSYIEYTPDGVTQVVIGEKKVQADTLIEFEAELINLGINAEEPLALGAKLLEWLANHKHPTSNGLSDIPSPSPKKDLLSEKVFTE